MALAMRSVPTGIRPSPSPRPAVLSRPPNVASGGVARLTGTSGTPALVGDGATAVATAQAVHHCARVPTRRRGMLGFRFTKFWPHQLRKCNMHQFPRHSRHCFATRVGPQSLPVAGGRLRIVVFQLRGARVAPCLPREGAHARCVRHDKCGSLLRALLRSLGTTAPILGVGCDSSTRTL